MVCAPVESVELASLVHRGKKKSYILTCVQSKKICGFLTSDAAVESVDTGCKKGANNTHNTPISLNKQKLGEP